MIGQVLVGENREEAARRLAIAGVDAVSEGTAEGKLAAGALARLGINKGAIAELLCDVMCDRVSQSGRQSAQQKLDREMGSRGIGGEDTTYTPFRGPLWPGPGRL